MFLQSLRIRTRLKKGWRLLTGQTDPVPTGGLWSSLLNSNLREWQAAKHGARGGMRVLMAPMMGGYQHATMLESTLAIALTLRHAQVDVLLCDSFLPGCQLTEFVTVSPERLDASPPQPRCASCQAGGHIAFDALGLPVYWISSLVPAGQRLLAREISQTVTTEDIGRYQFNGLAVGEHALAGALRYFARGTLQDEPQRDIVIRRYLEAALLVTFAIQNLLDKNQYDAVCFNHGLYVPQGLIGEVCRQQGVRVVNWNPAYRKHRFIFSHGDTYHHTMISEPASVWENIPWNSEIETETRDYLKSRWQGTQDWIWFHDAPIEDIRQIAHEIGFDPDRPYVVLLTNVMWDAQLHYGSNAFENMLEWVVQSIRYFIQRPELQLVIRVHPAEVRGALPSRQRMVDEINQVFPELPLNIFVVPPENRTSTYTLLNGCDSALIYNTKTGIEATSMSIPVVVAGEAWIRNKGFSFDATSVDEYIDILNTLPFEKRLGSDQTERARKYAYHFFFRRMIPLPFITQADNSHELTLALTGLSELSRGHSAGLDVICDGILTGTPFIYPAEYLTREISIKDVSQQ